MDTFQEIWISKIGKAEVLDLKSRARVPIQKKQVRIKVVASGVNFADIMARMGLYPDAPKIPCVVGYEVSGHVLESTSDKFSVGDSVFAMTRFGGYSEEVLVPDHQVFCIPKNLNLKSAAAIPVNYLTAWIMLVWHGSIKKGQSVLIHAGAGGVGQAAIQIAKHFGAKIYCTASASKHARLNESGSVTCIDYHHADFLEEIMMHTKNRGVDLVLDSLGAASFKKSYRALAPLGKLLCFGVSSFGDSEKRKILHVIKSILQTPRFNSLTLMNDNKGVIGVNMGHLWDQYEKLQNMMQEMILLFEQGILSPVIDREFKFTEAAEAHRYIQERKNFGKVLLVP